MATDRWTRQACLALFLLVAGARLAAVLWVGAHLPHWDQWFAEFGAIVVPLAQGRLGFLDLAASRNEHWLLYPKLISAGLTAASGRWEPLDESIVSALIRGITLSGAFLILGRNRARREQAVLLILLGLMGALPLGVFNLISGYQVQFFLGEILAVGALAFLCGGPLSVERLAGGSVCLILALLNMASPFITATAAALVLSLRGLLTPRRRENASVAAFLFILAGAIFWMTPRTARVLLGARDIPEFGTALLKLWAWPFPEAPLAGIVSVVPFLLLLWRVLRDRDRTEARWFVLALSCSALIQDAVIAYARAQSGTSFPQYRDGLWFRTVVGFLALTEALRPSAAAAPANPHPPRGAFVWAVGVAAIMLIDAGVRGAPELSAVRSAAPERQARLARALATGEFGAFDRDIESIRASGSLRFFDDPSGRFAVPPPALSDLREKRLILLPRLPAALAGAEPSMVSRGLRGLASLGVVCALAGALLLAGCARSAFRESLDSAGAGRT